MKKNQFLTSLRQHLSSLPSTEIEDIIRDQEEYINDAVLAGRSEEEVINGLADPKLFAANLIAELNIEKATQSESFKQKIKAICSAALAIFILAPFSFIFILIPLLILIFFISIGWLIALFILGGGLGSLGLFFSELIFIPVTSWTHLSTFFLCCGLIGLGISALLLMFQLSRGFILGTINYLKFNFKFIKNRL